MYRYQNGEGQDCFYKNALFDTNVIREILRNFDVDDGFAVRVLKRLLWNNEWLITFGYANIIELQRCPELLTRFYKFCAELQIIADSKSEYQILDEEISNYPNATEVCPNRPPQWVVRETDGSFLSAERVEELYEGVRSQWSGKIREQVQRRLSDILRLRASNSRYFKLYGLKGGIDRLVRKEVLKRRKISGIDPAKFPSLQARFAGEYFKFYEDLSRHISENDIWDLTMFPLLPYVEKVITDSNNVEIIRKIKNKFGLLGSLEAERLSDASKER